jgi:DNA invertase Pin-like site-specific DNA recombinase
MAAGVPPENVVCEAASGKNMERTGLQKILFALQIGDTLVCPKFDRLSRNTADLLGLCERLQQEGITIEFLNPSISIDGSASGKLMLTIFGAFAEFERAQILERTAAGRAAAYKSGKIPNRPRQWTDRDALRAYHLKQDGWDITAIMKLLNMHRASTYKIIKRGKELNAEQASREASK